MSRIKWKLIKLLNENVCNRWKEASRTPQSLDDTAIFVYLYEHLDLGDYKN